MVEAKILSGLPNRTRIHRIKDDVMMWDFDRYMSDPWSDFYNEQEIYIYYWDGIVRKKWDDDCLPRSEWYWHASDWRPCESAALPVLCTGSGAYPVLYVSD
jgi:hypothetical protein